MGIEEDALGEGKKKNSKAKGGKWERKAAKLLTSLTGKRFARTPSSGGLRWVNNQSVCGDITLEDQSEHFPFTVEVKAYESLGLIGSYKRKKRLRKDTKVLRFFDQAWEDAQRAGKTPMLLVRENGMQKDQFFLFVRKELFDKTGLEPDITIQGLSGIDTNRLKDLNLFIQPLFYGTQ